MLEYLILFSILFFITTVPLNLYLKKRNKEKSILFYAGIFHFFIGIPMLPSLLLYVGTGFCFIGLVYFFLSKQSISKPIQIILSLAPMTILIAIQIYSSPSRNVFLIPTGFTGRVVIIHSCSDGQETQYEGLSRVYKIPESGILKSKFSFAGSSFDSLNSHYYYVDSLSVRKKISLDINDIHPHGIWSLPHSRTGDTIIDFIVDTLQENPYNYKQDKTEVYQKEIDSCRYN